MTDMTLFGQRSKEVRDLNLGENYRGCQSEQQLVWRILNRARESELAHPPCIVQGCETPIERVLAWALLKFDYCAPCRVHLQAGMHEMTPGFALEDFLLNLQWSRERGGLSNVILGASQVQVGKHRVDFLLGLAMFREESPPYLLAVECDGHDFHEKTKQQAARDKRRDRDLAAMGVQTMRFTGSEIWRDPEGCANEVYARMFDESKRLVDIWWDSHRGRR